LKVVYIALDPLKYPRIKKIAQSIRKLDWVEFEAMIPKFRAICHGHLGRIFFAVANYLAVLFQVFFVKADIFWVANCPDILTLPLVLRRKKYLLEYRSPWSMEVEREFGRGPWVRLTAIVESIGLRNSMAITLTTSKLLSRVSSFSKPIFVIPNFPTKNFKALSSAEDFRKRYGVKSGERIVLFVGKLTRIEGADMLPEIIEQVLKKVNCVFWIVGDGPLLSDLITVEEKFGDRVRSFGWKPNEEVPDFINAADICIAPRHISAYSQFYNEEGLQKLSEYMFFQKPIVACGVARSNEYLLVDENDMADGILKALNGMVHLPRPRTWEDYSEKKIYEMFDLIYCGKI